MATHLAPPIAFSVDIVEHPQMIGTARGSRARRSTAPNEESRLPVPRPNSVTGALTATVSFRPIRGCLIFHSCEGFGGTAPNERARGGGRVWVAMPARETRREVGLEWEPILDDVLVPRRDRRDRFARPFPRRPGGAQAKRRGRCRRCRRSSECTEGSGQTAAAGGRRRRPRRARRRRARGGRGAGRFPGPKRGPRRAPVVRMESWAKKRRRRPIARAPPATEPEEPRRRRTRTGERRLERSSRRAYGIEPPNAPSRASAPSDAVRSLSSAVSCARPRRRAPPTRLVRIRGGRRTLAVGAFRWEVASARRDGNTRAPAVVRGRSVARAGG